MEQEWIVDYYAKENGEIPVEDFLLTLEPKLRAKEYSTFYLTKINLYCFTDF